MSNMEKSKIQLVDGTVLSLRLNGTEYESDTPIADEVLSEENLSNVTIDGVNKGKMKLNSKYPYEGGTRFSLRELTSEEETIEKLNAQLTQTQVGLTEVYEMLLSTSAQSRRMFVMAYVYADLIKKGTINPKTGKLYTIDDVPSVIRANVEKILAQDE